MATAELLPGRANQAPRTAGSDAGLFWRAPLAPLAVAATAGVVADRYVELAPALSLSVGALLVVGWWIWRRTALVGMAPALLWCAAATLASSYHHLVRHGVGTDDIGRFVRAEPRPARVRGVVNNAPVLPKRQPRDIFRGFAEYESTRFVLRAHQLKEKSHWRTVSGLIQVNVQDRRDDLHIGDEVEIVGRLAAPATPGNPGEFDYAAFLLDQGIRATMNVRHAAEQTEDSSSAIRILAPGRGPHLGGFLAWVGNECRVILDRALPENEAAVARALLLGDTSAMTSRDWDKYLNTGVIHALAISGQHLVVLGGLAWIVLRLTGVRRRWSALAVALFLFGYAHLVGGRPPVMRAAWMMLAWCGGLMIQRPTYWANSFALAWLLVLLFNPTDIFNAGCLLSFLAVAVLYWGTGRWRPMAQPLERLIDESRALWWRGVRRLGAVILAAYAVNLVVWIAVTPLAAARFHLVAPIAILIGPPIVLLTSIALAAGFLLIILAPLCWPLAVAFAALTGWSLRSCEAIVTWGSHFPGGYWHVPDLPSWWLWGFYVLLLVSITTELLWRKRLYCLLGGLGWLALGLAVGVMPLGRGDFRCTFVAVGHGGCTVIETPDGRTLVYDAGAMTGPDVARRHIAPFLWSRGIRRVDELFLSHADLDHFNGIGDLLERFAVGQVTTTQNFLDRPTAQVREALAILRRRDIPLRTLRAGDRLAAGSVDLHVLHPPAGWQEGNENARSLVLLVKHAGRTILLTGDLEGPGLERVLSLARPEIDVLMAPHHGSRTANTPELAEWAEPRVVVSCEGKPRGVRSGDPYRPRGGRFLSTHTHGAVTLRMSARGMFVETYRTQERWLVESRPK